MRRCLPVATSTSTPCPCSPTPSWRSWVSRSVIARSCSGRSTGCAPVIRSRRRVLRTPTPPSISPRRSSPPRAALEGERKQVTVLFADLKGSMELLADRDPEEARKLLDPVLERMMEAVHHYEGTVNQVHGRRDHGAVRRAARPRGSRRARLLRRAADAGGGQAVRRRACGAATASWCRSGSGSTPARSSCARSAAICTWTTRRWARPPTWRRAWSSWRHRGRSCSSADTLRLAEGYVQVKSLGPGPRQGVARTDRGLRADGGGSGAHAPAGSDAARPHALRRPRRRDRALAPGPQPGRRGPRPGGRRRGRGRAWASRGSSTSSPTRIGCRTWLIVEASSVSYGKATSYLPVIDLLKGYFKIGDRDDHREMREKVTGKLLALDRALEPLLPPLLALLDVPIEDAAWQNLDPPAAPPAHARRGQAPAAARSPGATAARGVRGPALGRRRDPGPAG